MMESEKIKKGLECCANEDNSDFVCGGCPYDSAGGECSELFSDALALIHQLEAQVPKWISMEERLPENGQWVLVYCGGYANWFDLNKWCRVNWLKTLPVTHWMPLPQPPKKDAHEAD